MSWRNLNRIFWSVLVVFVMLSSAFAVLSYAVDEPAIWTYDDLYLPGETVIMKGEGWMPYAPVTIVLSHPDLGVQTFTEGDGLPDTNDFVDQNGEFVFDEYVAEAVEQEEIPISVTATQYYMDKVLTATTEFYDPGVTYEGFTLAPHPKWTSGDVKGYNEGDTVPYKLTVPKSFFDTERVTLTVKFDYHDLSVDAYGVDYLAQYWDETPNAPFNIYPPSDEPFYIDPAEGSIVDQFRMADETDAGGQLVVQVWRLVFDYAAGSDEATVRFGAHMALTVLPDYLGASYYPGSSLHVAFEEIGSRDVPIALGQVLMPPEMTLEKYGDKSTVVLDEVITFELVWSNIGQADACCVEIWDTVPWVLDIIPGSFQFWTSEHPTPMIPSPGPVVMGNDIYWLIGTWRGTGEGSELPPLVGHLSFQAVVDEAVPGCYKNEAWLSFTDDHGGEYDDLYAFWPFCIIAPPAIDIEKSGPLYAHVGETITYTYVVSNTGVVDLVDVDVWDDVVGWIAVDLYLAAGASTTIDVDYTVPTRLPDPLVNVVTATGEDDYGRTVSDSDSWSVDILEPMIDVTKDANKECAEVSEEVVYTIRVFNPSYDTKLYDVVVSDPILGLLWSGTLNPRQAESWVISYDVQAGDPDPLVNVVSASGEDIMGWPASDSARWIVEIYHPMIEIVKWADKTCAEVGETVTYWITVSNPSWDTVMHAVVTDPLLSATPLFDGDLNPGQSVPLGPYPYVVLLGWEWVENTAYVTAWDTQDHTVYDSSSWEVEVLYPAVMLTKTSEWLCAAEGELVTYTITVANTGDTPLVRGTVEDLSIGWSAALPSLDVGESTSFTVTVPMPAGDVFVNTATVRAYDRQDHERTDSDSWTIDIRHPMIEVTKTADVGRCAAVGDTITYTIVVFNPSPDTWMYYYVEDSMLSWWASGDLGPGESDTYGVYYLVTELTPDPLINVVEVEAWDDQVDDGGEYWLHQAFDTDTWTVDILHAMIDVEKWADVGNCAAIGDTVTYTIVVTNPSRDTPMNYQVWDDVLGWEESGYLAPGGSDTYTLTYVITENTPDWFVNHVDVWGYDDQYYVTDPDDRRNHEAFDWDEWTIDILHPMIDVEKSADVGHCAAIGDTITYTITVSNPSVDTPMNFYVEDLALGFYAGGWLIPGASMSFYPTYVVTADTPDPFVNVVNVWGWDDQWETTAPADQENHEAFDTDTWDVDILHPAIDVEKTADVGNCAAIGDMITYTIVVSNPSADTWMNYEVWDDLLGWGASGYLAPGGSDTYDVYYWVDEQTPDPLINTVIVWGYDNQYYTTDPGDQENHEAWDRDSWYIDILHADIDVTKTADVGNCAAVGDTITYTITVSNPSDDTWMNYNVYDYDLGWSRSGYLAPGDSDIYEVEYLVTADTPDWFWNEVYVFAWDDQYYTSADYWNHYAEAWDWWYVDILHAAIDIEKWADVGTCAHEDERIGYYFDLYNPSWDTAVYVEVYDSLLGGLLWYGYLMPFEFLTIGPYYYTVPDGVEWVYNYVEAYAYDDQYWVSPEWWNHYALDWDDWLIEILNPAIDVEKTGPLYANVGDTVTYTVTVSNVGDTDLFEVSVYDSLLGATVWSGDLPLGDSETFSYTYTIPSGSAYIDNTVYASGRDRQYVWVYDQDSWRITVYGMVMGYKFADYDMDGMKELGEPGIANWLIELEGYAYDGSYYYNAILTDSDGYYAFGMMKPGAYTVSESLPAGWVTSTPPVVPLDLGAGEAQSVNFGNMPTGSITACKWEDENLNGLWDDGESPVPGWGMVLAGEDLAGNLVYLEGETGLDGCYAFTGLYPGVYQVSEEVRAGWYATTPMIVMVDVSALEVFEETVCFGNVLTGSITGYKYLDEHMNGEFELPFEDGIEGWKITLTGVQNDGTVVGPIDTYTDENGFYHFDGLLPGVYTVTEESRPGWVATTPTSWTFTLIDGRIECASFGNVELGKIWGWKFLDWDMDGAKDDNEPGIPGWEITLEGWLNDGLGWYTTIGSTHVGPITILTDENGYWEFIVLPGVYIVSEEERENWYHTTDAFEYLLVGSGGEVPRVKFGNVPYTCLWGYKFEDDDGDGERDEGEDGVPGWEIIIDGVQNDGVQVHIELVTDETGMWRTCFNILPGTYVIREVMQQGWMPTTPELYEVCLQMVMEPVALQFDFGNFKLGKICGYKYVDYNGNGILDDGDYPKAGWRIDLYFPWPGMATTYTDENGYFEFVGLPWGMYLVVEEDRAGWIHTTDSFFDVFIDVSGDVERVLFLNFELGCICGWKFEDSNSNGVWDDDEDGIPRWQINMMKDGLPTVYTTYTDENGWFCFPGLTADYYVVWEASVEGWTQTTPYGYIVDIFSGTCAQLPPFGNFHNVWITLFKYNDLWGDGVYNEYEDDGIEGWHITVTGPGVPGGSVTVVTDAYGYAYVELTAAGTYTITEEDVVGWCHTTDPDVVIDVLSGWASSTVVEFGNFQCVDLTFFKYEDVNSDGLYDPLVDEPIEDWVIYAWESMSDLPVVLVTDEDGYAYMHLCVGGWWIFFEELPDGWCKITPEGAYYDVAVVSGKAYNLDTQEEQYLYEFGNFECIEIEVFKYWDTCSNGWYDPDVGDIPLPGWWIGLYDASGYLIDSDYTDDEGKVYFEVCRAGTYFVVEWVQDGWVPINPELGYHEIEVKSGDDVLLWFGNYRLVEVTIFKYVDVNSNGVFDNGDVPKEGWYFEMEQITGGGAFFSGYTDENGLLVFSVSRSGIYLITEEDRDGWTHVNPASGERLINVVSNIVVPVQEFGNFENAYILVCKVDDIDADGYFDDNEVTIPGWSFTLWVWDPVEEEWVFVETKLTGECGCVLFEITKAGVYKVTEESRDGWLWICPWNGYRIVEVESGDRMDLYFYNFKKGKIYGYKWNDLNGDGDWDTGEPGLPGWTIWFQGRLGDAYLSGYAITNADGYYEFTGLPPGVYEVWEIGQPGWIPTSPPEVEDVVVIGHSEIRIDFLNFQLGCIEGYKYVDYNGNGILDDGDYPMPGWTIYLSITTGVVYDDEGNPMSAIMLIATTTTDEDGYYRFCGLGPGIYVVDEESRSGWIATNAASETVTMTSGAHIRIHTFLNFELGCICGWKFEDSNSNGVWDDDEDGIPRWQINMMKDGLPTVYTTYTDENGWFCFPGLTADYYVVWEASVEGWTQTTPYGYIVDIFSGTCAQLPPFGNFKNVEIDLFKYEDANANGVYDNGDSPIEDWMFTVSGPGFPVPAVVYTDENGEASVVVTMAGTYIVTEEDKAGWTHINPASGEMTVDVLSGMVLERLEFGNFMKGSVYGYKFHDWDASSIYEAGERPLQGWFVELEGWLVGGGYYYNWLLTTDTGYFEFTGLMPGEYVLREGTALGWVPTNGTAFWFDATSGFVYRKDFGNVLYGDIWGYKFYDKDMDGLMDDNEPGLPDWTVILEGEDDMGNYVYREVETDEYGYYRFDEVQPGVYTVSEVLQPGWTNTVPTTVVVDESGASSYFVVRVDFGNIRFGKIWGYKFLDSYEDRYPFWPNGVFDDDEWGLGNWRITLQGYTDTGVRVDLERFTDNIDDPGYYEFCNVLPGRYWVNETLMFGYYASRPIANFVIIYPFPMGPVIMRIDFGNLIPSPDPEINFVMRQGWNLWSMPIVVEGLTAKSLLAKIGPSGVAVTRADKAANKLVSYVAGLPDAYDFPIVMGEGYYVAVKTALTFSLKGDLQPASDTVLGKGWNLIGFSELEPIMASELMSRVVGGTATVVTCLDPNEGKLESYVAGLPAAYDFWVTPGRAYFIYVTAPSVLEY